jgi:hypothetical protein
MCISGLPGHRLMWTESNHCPACHTTQGLQSPPATHPLQMREEAKTPISVAPPHLTSVFTLSLVPKEPTNSLSPVQHALLHCASQALSGSGPGDGDGRE